MATKLETPRIPPLEIKDWDPGLRKSSWIGSNVKDKSDLPEFMAKVFNVTATLANYPMLSQNWNHFAMHVMGTNSLSPRIREIAIIRIGYLCESDYELSQHAWIGEMSGLTKDEVRRVTEGANAEGWTELESLIIKAVDELKENNIVSDETWYALEKNGLSKNQMMDLVFTAGQYNLVSWALNSFGVQLDEGLPSYLDGMV